MKKTKAIQLKGKKEIWKAFSKNVKGTYVDNPKRIYTAIKRLVTGKRKKGKITKPQKGSGYIRRRKPNSKRRRIQKGGFPLLALAPLALGALSSIF